jgi:hypothetical protein
LSRGCKRSCGVPCENVCLGAARRCVRAVEAERASWHLFVWGPITLGHVWSGLQTSRSSQLQQHTVRVWISHLCITQWFSDEERIASSRAEGMIDYLGVSSRTCFSNLQQLNSYNSIVALSQYLVLE